MIQMTTADEINRRKKLVACINDALYHENEESKIVKSEEIHTLIAIVDEVLNKEPLKKPSKAHMKEMLMEVETKAKKQIPEVKTSAIDALVKSIKGYGIRCWQRNN